MLNRRTSLAFLDLLFILLLALLLLINPPPKEGEADPVGDITVEIQWPDGQDCDVDLWVQAPGDKAVGYSSKSSVTMNLLRDDLGRMNDLGAANYEFVFSRGFRPGEYIVNVHLFRIGGNCELPIPVAVRITMIQHGIVKPILATVVALERYGQELTVRRFSLREDGSVIPGSYNTLPKSLRIAPEP